MRSKFSRTISWLAATGLAACGGGGGTPPPADEAASVIPEKTAERLRATGGEAADALTQTLQGHLRAAMQEGGFPHAVEFCARRAPALADSVSAALGEGVEVRRVSSRFRNPANAPDPAETAALRHFVETQEETGALPSEWVQRTADGEYRYYRALTVAPPCLACHGPTEAIDPSVREILSAAYPEDRATGYAAGDFRGLIRVTVPASRVEG
ncbi:MAG: DUF3365 domain-containing protein [Gemmatimonadota bacterium]|nr:DUF3365 domain-containing protein [Gemmatimonadota bacterium]